MVVGVVDADRDLRPVRQPRLSPCEIVLDGHLVVAATLEDEHRPLERRRGGHGIVAALVQPVGARPLTEGQVRRRSIGGQGRAVDKRGLARDGLLEVRHGWVTGQLAWIVERFKDWTDSTDVPEDAVDRDAMLTNVMIYWLNGTAGSSARYYYEGPATRGGPEPETDVPVAVAVLPQDLGIPVRRIAERNHNIVRWTEFDRGGHFAAMEEPDLIIDDLRAAFRDHRQ